MEGDFKYSREGRRINAYLIRRPVPFTRSPRSALQPEEYGHPDGHLSRRGLLVPDRNSTNEFSDKHGAVQRRCGWMRERPEAWQLI